MKPPTVFDSKASKTFQTLDFSMKPPPVVDTNANQHFFFSLRLGFLLHSAAEAKIRCPPQCEKIPHSTLLPFLLQIQMFLIVS